MLPPTDKQRHQKRSIDPLSDGVKEEHAKNEGFAYVSKTAAVRGDPGPQSPLTACLTFPGRRVAPTQELPVA